MHGFLPLRAVRAHTVAGDCGHLPYTTLQLQELGLSSQILNSSSGGASGATAGLPEVQPEAQPEASASRGCGSGGGGDDGHAGSADSVVTVSSVVPARAVTSLPRSFALCFAICCHNARARMVI